MTEPEVAAGLRSPRSENQPPPFPNGLQGRFRAEDFACQPYPTVRPAKNESGWSVKRTSHPTGTLTKMLLTQVSSMGKAQAGWR